MKRSDPIMEKIKTFKIKRFPPELTQQWTKLGHWAKGRNGLGHATLKDSKPRTDPVSMDAGSCDCG